MDEALPAALQNTKSLLKLMGIDTFAPKVSKSKIWVEWITNFGPGTCLYCAD